MTVNDAVTSRAEFATTLWVGNAAHLSAPPPPVPPLARAVGAATQAADMAAASDRMRCFFTVTSGLVGAGSEDACRAVGTATGRWSYDSGPANTH